jgi:hypothetical protein
MPGRPGRARPRVATDTVSPRGYGVRVGHPVFVLLCLGTLVLWTLASAGPVRGSAVCVAATVTMVVAAFALLFSLRLEVGAQALRYRCGLAWHAMAYAQMERAAIGAQRSTRSPQGVAVFSVHGRDGSRFEIPLKMFAIAAAATLFERLERNRVALIVEDAWAARRMAQAIDDERARRRRRGATFG